MNTEEYLSHVYGNVEGNLAIASINGGNWSEKNIASAQLQQDMIYEKDNVFLSINTFFGYRRGKNCIKRLNMICIDIDCYQKGISKEQAMDEISKMIDTGIIPRPTFLIDSGNGLYYQLCLTQNSNSIIKGEHKYALPRYQLFQNYLFSKLQHLGADHKTLDVSHVFRPVGSYNSKDKRKKVSVLWYMPYNYTLDELLAEYMEEEYNRFKQKKNITEKKHKGKKVVCLHTVYSLAFNRIKDIEKLYLSIRKDNIEAIKGTREHACFLYRYYSLFICDGNEDMALEATLRFNASLACPLEEKEVIRATKSAQKGYKNFLANNKKGYNYKSSTIVDDLAISESEQLQLNFLCSAEIRKIKKSHNDKIRYQNKLKENGKTTKKEKIEERREQVKKLYASGKDVMEICRILKISKRTCYRDLEKLNKEEMIKDTFKENTTKEIVSVCDAKKEESTVKEEKERCVKNFTPILLYSVQSPRAEKTQSFSFALFRLFMDRDDRDRGS